MMRVRLGLIVCFCCFALTQVIGQVSISPATVNFFTVTKGEPDSVAIVISNNKPVDPMVVTGIRFHHTDAFYVKESSFTINAGQTKTVWVYCNPRHNVRYLDWLVVETSTEATVLSAFVFAQGQYANPYYIGTQNRWDEDLEANLKTLISFGYTDLGYTAARDEIFIHIDNKAYNGQGAAQNTIECVYTGITAVGYTNRQDCQTNYNFNTEHTVPQSLFSQNPPMVSDMHHLWGTDAAANSERGDNPYGIVNNPSWSVGGSKSNGTIFEPRDAFKGKAARAVLYFALRYQDFGNFIAPQESLLRAWSNAHQPDSVEVKRNDDIQALQNNRNPFSDHPEFLERITRLVGTGNRAIAPKAYLGADSLFFKSPFPGSKTGYFVLSNQGLDTLTYGNFTFSNPDFSIPGSPILPIPPDSARKIYVRLNPGSLGLFYDETVTFETDDVTNATMTVHLLGESVLVGNESPNEMTATVYPNPVQNMVHVAWPSPLMGNATLELRDVTGKLLIQRNVNAGNSEFGMEVDDVKRGCYFLYISENGVSNVFKVILI